MDADQTRRWNAMAVRITELEKELAKLNCMIYDAMQIADADTLQVLKESGIDPMQPCPTCEIVRKSSHA